MTLKEMKNLSPEEQKALFSELDSQRDKGKKTNYTATYGAGGKAIAESAEVPEEEGMDLHVAYWEKNWAIKAIARAQKIKFFYKMGREITYTFYTGDDLMPNDIDSWHEKQAKYKLANSAVSMWLWNPVSEMWYSLRYVKDIFSTLNQGTGVFVFDSWIKEFRKEIRKLTGQMHDEVILNIRRGKEDYYKDVLNRAIEKVNKDLKLNRDMGVDIHFGDRYSEVH